MSSTPLVCPKCGKPVIVYQQYCFNCGSPLAWAGAGGGAPTSWAAAQSIDLASTGQRARDRTRTGLLLMIIAFAILWIPYVGDIGSLMGLIGVVFRFLGRTGFTDLHHRLATLGSAAVLVALLLGIGVVIWFVAAVVSAATAPGETLVALGAAFRSDLVTLFVVVLVTSGIGGLGYVALPYALADRTTRIVLWVAFGASLLIAILNFAILWPEISNAIVAATSGVSPTSAPITALDGKSTLLGTLQVGPDLMFLLAYYQTRAQIPKPPAPPSDVGAAEAPIGRTD
ncbi:MAG: zinc ribbon domain-containing protein [Thermoplasmata archaeon]